MVRKRQKPQFVWYAREWMVHKGLRQTDIVERTGIPKGMVSAYLSRSRRINEDILAAFAGAIGVDAADLLRPPHLVENELARFVMELDEQRRQQALRLLKAIG